MDDDSESIITNERYNYISSIIGSCYTKKNKGGMTISDKIDRIVTNRILALPIFAVIMFIVYYVSVTTVGGIATDWANDGVFGDGWHLFGIGSAAAEDADGEYSDAMNAVMAFVEASGDDALIEAMDAESEEYDPEAAQAALDAFAATVSEDATADYTLEDETPGYLVDFEVPEGQFFVMGDNRRVSIDSRSEEVGCVDEEQIVGKAFVRLYPFSEIGGLY